tara:strand:- start:27 stop:158 length:132 start_codon:yes stop_codon:yes gene_type:complete
VLYTTFDGYNFVYALALSEAATFVIAAAYFLHYRPKLVATGQS